MMRRSASVMFVALLLAGCASLGFGISESFARSWKCDPAWVEERQRRLTEQHGSTRFVPRVGWSACELMAQHGRPSDIDLQRSAGRETASWWYNSRYDAKLVSLENQGNRWRVVYVGW